MVMFNCFTDLVQLYESMYALSIHIVDSSHIAFCYLNYLVYHEVEYSCGKGVCFFLCSSENILSGEGHEMDCDIERTENSLLPLW